MLDIQVEHFSEAIWDAEETGDFFQSEPLLPSAPKADGRLAQDVAFDDYFGGGKINEEEPSHLQPANDEPCGSPESTKDTNVTWRRP